MKAGARDGLGSASAIPTCNIVMKGGITSGVVYPLAVVEIARAYRFAGIGGTSAGAIAAALTAAAEKGRDQGGFEKIAAVAKDLPRRMRGLFQPAAEHKPLFGLLMRLARRQSRRRLLWSALRGAAMAYPVTVALGALPAAGLLAAGWMSGAPLMAAVAATLALVVFPALALAIRLWRIVAHDLPATDFGLCPGIRQAWAGEDGLVDWLADRLDDVAAQPQDPATGATKPLTFGDLDGDDPAQPAIDLQMFTTCLSTGRPHVMPWSYRVFLYRPDEMRRLFPERIVAWMDAHSRPDEHDARLRTFPARKDLPVIVPVRMSLSFPLLFATVPLWMRDYTLRDEAERTTPRRVSFADGGMCSNLPLQLFDHLWPKRPTFAIALDAFTAERNVAPGGAEVRVRFPRSAGAGLLLPVAPMATVGAYVGRMLDAMQNWQDRLQSTLPGYRERIVHVYLKDDEGGLNLDMDPSTIAGLAQLGRQAGEELATAFNWPAHRWTRVVSAIDRLADTMGALDDETVAFVRDHTMARSRHRQSVEWQQGAVAALEQLRAVEGIRTGALAPTRAPRPQPQLRMTPRP